ncbi:MAG TPA: hypothetical protein PLY68_02130 [Myxococcota bacterium]|nr:hypothetical protein [Myxococcota bacterium]HPB49885.1 hypothetical protein [Myxococcota bacterium]HQP94976.1 hypothetical protein [Myxococcota bacterium]
MKTFRSVLVLMAVAGCFMHAQVAIADSDCARPFINEAAGGQGLGSLKDVMDSEHGILASFATKGAEGRILVLMTAVQGDLNTFQSVWGRKGVSSLTSDESAWLGGVLQSLDANKQFMACPGLASDTAPTTEQANSLMAGWWKELNRVKAASEARGPMVVLIVLAVAVLFVAVVVLLVIRRVRRGRARVGGTEPEAVEAVTPAAADEPREIRPEDENQEVL